MRRPRSISAALAAVVLAAGLAQARIANHLASASEPYLKSAKDQPVDWHPWGDEAWQAAQKLDRPLLVDVGAVWCSFCHAMDRESYTVPATAAFINSHFVPVRVDFDAQPDLARKLQKAAALANVPVGLPQIVFITPDGKAYAGGSYLPARPSERRPSLQQAMEEALRIYRSDRQAVERDGVDVR